VVSVLLVTGAAMSVSPHRALGQNDGNQRGDSAETATDESEETTDRRRLSVDEHGATLRRPEGWVEASGQKKALFTLRAAGDRRAQIEIRASSPIKQTRSDSFFNSFHSRLRDAGFVREKTRQQAEYGGNIGKWTVYEGRSDRDVYRLVVWQLYRQEVAWLFVGFFPAEAGTRYDEDFENLIESLSFE
jgi:hypothetical protein